LAEISNYINKFNVIVSETGIYVITDSKGNIEKDAPANMSEELAKKVSLKISIIDSLINKRQSDVSELIDKGLTLQKIINSVDPPPFTSLKY